MVPPVCLCLAHANGFVSQTGINLEMEVQGPDTWTGAAPGASLPTSAARKQGWEKPCPFLEGLDGAVEASYARRQLLEDAGGPEAREARATIVGPGKAGEETPPQKPPPSPEAVEEAAMLHELVHVVRYRRAPSPDAWGLLVRIWDVSLGHTGRRAA